MTPLASPADPQAQAERLPLPLADQPQPMRADAARNRARLLEAASRLVAEHGPEHLTMEAVAAAASVGKGTVFRRFGDRTGLLLALLDHTEATYQASFLAGPPPLGPGAPAIQRLQAFGTATLRHLDAHRALYLAAEADATRRLVIPPRRVRLAHIAVLLREAGTPGDTELFAEALMGYLDIALLNHLTQQRGMSLERLEAGWRDLVTRITQS